MREDRRGEGIGVKEGRRGEGIGVKEGRSLWKVEVGKVEEGGS